MKWGGITTNTKTRSDRNPWAKRPTVTIRTSPNAPTDRAGGVGTGEFVDTIVTFGEGTAGGGGVGRWTITYSTLRADRIEADLRQPQKFWYELLALELIGTFWIRGMSFRW